VAAGGEVVVVVAPGAGTGALPVRHRSAGVKTWSFHAHRPVVRQTRRREPGINHGGLRLRPPVHRRTSAYACGVILDTGRCMTITLRNAHSQLSK
jgi:hypothetical protein